MPLGSVIVSDLEPAALAGGTLVALVLSVGAYLAAKVRLGWWPPRRPRR